MARIEELLPEFRKGARIRLSHWDEEVYIIQDSKGFIVDNQGKVRLFYSDELLSDKWELYKDPIDWDAVIRNKCLCWFWNNTGKTKYLNYLQAKEEYAFRDEQGACWENCRPVRRDEVTFYEVEYE